MTAPSNQPSRSALAHPDTEGQTAAEVGGVYEAIHILTNATRSGYLPGCMMPDGAEPCSAFSEQDQAIHAALAALTPSAQPKTPGAAIPTGSGSDAGVRQEPVGSWMQTYSLPLFRPLDPKPEYVRIEDIAHHLSQAVRYGGAGVRWYSVAEHSVHLARAAAPEHALWALLHDASEAYLHDVVRPVKRTLTGYAAAEDRLMLAICERFGLPPTMPSEVKSLDNRIVIDERAQNMRPSNVVWTHGGEIEPLGITLRFWTPEEAEREFLALYSELTGYAVEVPALSPPTGSAGDDETGVREALKALCALIPEGVSAGLQTPDDDAWLGRLFAAQRQALKSLATQPPKAGTPRTITTPVIVSFNTRKLTDLATKVEAGGTLDDGEMCFLFRLAWQRMDDLAATVSPKADTPAGVGETDTLVARFAVALKAKLRASEAKYGWQNGWLKPDWQADCQRDLARHVAKGDPLDVAAYAAFCWHHGWSTAALSLAPAAQAGDGVERVRHLKRGTEYEVLGEAEVQIATRQTCPDGIGNGVLPNSAIIREGRAGYESDKLTVYRDPKSGKLWCRFTDEFRDGRFVTLTAAPAADGGAA